MAAFSNPWKWASQTETWAGTTTTGYLYNAVMEASTNIRRKPKKVTPMAWLDGRVDEVTAKGRKAMEAT